MMDLRAKFYGYLPCLYRCLTFKYFLPHWPAKLRSLSNHKWQMTCGCLWTVFRWSTWRLPTRTSCDHLPTPTSTSHTQPIPTTPNPLPKIASKPFHYRLSIHLCISNQRLAHDSRRTKLKKLKRNCSTIVYQRINGWKWI